MSDTPSGENQGFSPELLAKLKDANLLERQEKNITRDLAISYNQSLVAFICRMLAEKDPKFAGYLSMFSENWIKQVSSAATERSKSFAHVPQLAEHLPEEMQRQLAQDYVTAHAKAARNIVDHFTKVAIPTPDSGPKG